VQPTPKPLLIVSCHASGEENGLHQRFFSGLLATRTFEGDGVLRWSALLVNRGDDFA
jgi:hypothetical protein